jgi:hypothetical protein
MRNPVLAAVRDPVTVLDKTRRQGLPTTLPCGTGCDLEGSVEHPRLPVQGGRQRTPGNEAREYGP